MKNDSIRLIALTSLMILAAFMAHGCAAIDKSKNIQNQEDLSQGTNQIDKNEFLDILNGELKNRVEWISRKEIASWSAALLYLSVVLFLFNKIKIFLNHKWITLISLVFFTFLIGLFIHQQYGQMVNAMAYSKTVRKYAVSLLDKDYIPKSELQTEKDDILPKFLSDALTAEQALIRRHHLCFRLFLPVKKGINFLWGADDRIKTVEVEEAILYDLLLLAFIPTTWIIIHTGRKGGSNQVKGKKRKKFLKRKSVLINVRNRLKPNNRRIV